MPFSRTEFLHEMDEISIMVEQRRRHDANWNSPWAFRVGPVIQQLLRRRLDESTAGYPFNTPESLELGLDALNRCPLETRILWHPWFEAARLLFHADVLISRRMRENLVHSPSPLDGKKWREQVQYSAVVALEYFDYVKARCNPVMELANMQRGVEIRSEYSHMLHRMENWMDPETYEDGDACS